MAKKHPDAIGRHFRTNIELLRKEANKDNGPRDKDKTDPIQFNLYSGLFLLADDIEDARDRLKEIREEMIEMKRVLRQVRDELKTLPRRLHHNHD